MLLYSMGALWVIGGQYGVAACDEICKDVTAKIGEVEDWMTNFDVRIIKFDTSLEIRRKLAEQHNRAQHSGRESSVPQLLNNFLHLAAEDTQCKKTVVALMCEAIVEAGLIAQSGNTETIVKQMRPTTHMALTCGATFTDALGKLLERKQVIALYTMQMLCWNATRKFVARMQLHGLAEEYSTGLPEAGKGAPRSGIVVVSLWSSRHAG